FYVRPEDINFYKKIRVPLPTLSPRERTRRKLAFTNAYNLFKVTSAFSGKSIIALYPPSTPYKIYEHKIWFGDEWDSMDYAVEYKDQKNFFEQYKELQHNVPRHNLYVDGTSVNCDYTNGARRSKNCYFVFGAWQAEDSAYSIELRYSRNCYDCFTLDNSDTCYDCFESSDLYHCFFVEYSKHCLNSYLLFDCRNCDHCFGCTNLRNKKYYFFNKPLTKAAYEKKMRDLNLGSREVLSSLKNKFDALKKEAFYKENHNERAIESYGEYLKGTKHCDACFYSIEGQNLSYCTGGIKTRDSYDLVGGAGSESCYDSYGSIQSQGIKFSQTVDACRDMEYCDLCTNCHDCFGCIGLRNKSFCIFNKQYSEEEYWKIIDNIKTKMLRDGIYGEFFPPSLSPFPYNISIATSYSGYDDIDVAERYGYRIENIEQDLTEVEGEVIDAQSLPDDIRDVSDDILGIHIFDRAHDRKFLIIKKELEFYRRYHIPLPYHHPSERLTEKRKKIGPLLFELHERSCAKCNKAIQTPYPPRLAVDEVEGEAGAADGPKNVYCEACYQAEVV
ncbi:hypothetical protein LCGC14_1769180, partial [marine sediment metagenome]